MRGRPGWSLKISEINNIRNVSPQMIQEARSLIKIPHREHASPELLALPPCAPVSFDQAHEAIREEDRNDRSHWHWRFGHLDRP